MFPLPRFTTVGRVGTPRCGTGYPERVPLLSDPGESLAEGNHETCI
jgi:hypothetical protein